METYYLSSVSVAATLFSILLIGLAVAGVWLAVRLKRILDKLDRLADTSSHIAYNVKELVQATSHRLIALEQAYLTVQGVRRTVSLLSRAFHKRKVHG
ncbi:MAG: hypothetical protein AB1469_06265 [Pseudomonadota bacterium]